MKEALLTDWAIVAYPDIHLAVDDPETVFATLNSGRTVALFGRAKNDRRFNAETTEFEDGHRIITSPIVEFKDGKCFTENTIYTLEEKNEKYRQWCEEPQYQEVSQENQSDMVLRHICENCGKEELLNSKDGFNQGWDYPPRMGFFKIVSPRTCGDCSITTTLWWEISCNKTPNEQLSERHKQTLQRILNEPESIMP